MRSSSQDRCTIWARLRRWGLAVVESQRVGDHRGKEISSGQSASLPISFDASVITEPMLAPEETSGTGEAFLPQDPCLVPRSVLDDVLRWFSFWTSGCDGSLGFSAGLW